MSQEGDRIGWQHIVTAWGGLAPSITMSHNTLDTAAVEGRVVLAGSSSQARGALWYLRATRAAGKLPDEGVVVAAPSASIAAVWAWAARTEDVPALLVVPPLPARTLHLLAGGVVRVHVDSTAELAGVCEAYVSARGVARPDPLDPLLAAGAGTWVLAAHNVIRDLSTVLIPVGDAALLRGTLAAARHYGLRTVLVAVDGGSRIPATARKALAHGTGFPGITDDEGRVRLEAVTVSTDDVQAARRILQRRGLAASDEDTAVCLAALTTHARDSGQCCHTDRHDVSALPIAGTEPPWPP